MNKSLLSNIKNTLLVLLALSISLSVVASNIILIMLLIIIVLEGDFSNKIKKIISSNWMISIISLLLLYYLYWIFFGKFTDSNWLLKRVSLLWLLPVFYSTNFTNKTIEKSVFSFFVSMFISSVLASYFSRVRGTFVGYVYLEQAEKVRKKPVVVLNLGKEYQTECELSSFDMISGSS